MNDYLDFIKSHTELFANSDEANAITVFQNPLDIEMVEKATHQEVGIMYKDAYILLVKDAVAFPDKSLGTYIRVLPANGKNGTVILPVLHDKILLIRHYRHALRRFLWELPRGFAENHLTAIENAKKELYEECGLTASKCEILGKISPDSGLLGSEPWVIKADIDEGEATHLSTNDSAEGIDGFKLVSVEEISHMIAQGDITDSMTISAVYLAIAQKSMVGLHL